MFPLFTHETERINVSKCKLLFYGQNMAIIKYEYAYIWLNLRLRVE